MVDLKATIIEDDNALISVDDLIMQIGILTVKIMEKDKIIQSTLQRLQELERKNIELSNEMNKLTIYKNDYEVLARRYNELAEELKRREEKILELERQLNECKDKSKKRDKGTN